MKAAKQCLIALIGAILVTCLLFTGALNRVDRWAQDGLFQRKSVLSSDIVIVGIDEYALETLGPFPTNYRDYVAFALEEMAADEEHMPAAVAIDILYEGNSTQSTDAHLANAAAQLGRVITASMAEYGASITWENGRATSLNTSAVLNYVLPYEDLKNVTAQGHINAMYDSDGVMRHALLYVDISENERVYSMAHEAARMYLASKGRTELPRGEPDRQFYVKYSSQPGDYYEGVSLAHVIYGQVPPEYWAGKIVLIGPYAPGLQDAYFDGKIVLIGPYASGMQDEYRTAIDHAVTMYGIEIQANVIQCLLDGSFKSDIPDICQYAAVFALSFLAMMLFLRLSLPVGGAVCLGFVVLGMGGSMLLFEAGYVTHPLYLAAAVLLLYIASLVLKYIRAARERHLLALEKERIGAELALATRIQASALPKTFPPFPERGEFEIFASMEPAKEVGGDLYDFFLLDQDHLAMVIGDVSGKGVPASLFMMVTMALLRHVMKGEFSPAKALQYVNSDICARNPEEMFVTVWVGVLEISTGRLTCANAGHEYPALKAPDGSFQLFKDRHGFVLGGMDGVRYREYELQLVPGSKLFVYTDGVPEATDKNNVLFGAERMTQALLESENGTPEEIISYMREAAGRFVGDAPQFDDMTMLCLQYNGTGKTEKAQPVEESPAQE